METGQQLSLWAIRIAIIFWFGFAVSLSSSRDSNVNWQWRRLLWTLATIFYLIHVVSAFAWFHEWSHSAATEHTAEMTRQVTGIDWGGGIWFNHLFTIVCFVQTIAWWTWPASVKKRSRLTSFLIYGYCLFIGFNATVVFASGPVRWIGLAMFVGLAFVWFTRGDRR